MKIRKSGLLLPLLAIAAIGCNGGSGSSSSSTTTTGTTDNGEKKLVIGLVFDTGGRGDKSFNDSAYRGLEKASKELGIEMKPVDSTSENDYEQNITSLAENEYDLVFAVGITMENALKNVAPKFPNTKFAIVDGNIEMDNVRSLKFSEEQGSFLAGYLAGLMTKSNKVGFVGGMEIPLIKKFEAGYIAGAKTANPKVEVLPAKYTGSWEDVALGKESARVLYSDGADIIYHAAGKTGLGVFTAAKEAGKFAIGVDSDQDHLEEGFILTSMIKAVDEAVFQTIKDVKEGKFSAGVKVYDLEAGGVGLSPMTYTKEKIGEANIAKIEDIKKKIIAGDIKVPANEADLKAFLAAMPKA